MLLLFVLKKFWGFLRSFPRSIYLWIFSEYFNAYDATKTLWYLRVFTSNSFRGFSKLITRSSYGNISIVMRKSKFVDFWSVLKFMRGLKLIVFGRNKK